VAVRGPNDASSVSAPFPNPILTLPLAAASGMLRAKKSF